MTFAASARGLNIWWWGGNSEPDPDRGGGTAGGLGGARRLRGDQFLGRQCGPGDGPLGTSRRVQVGRDTLVERITDFDPQTALAYDIEGLPRRLNVGNRWTLRPSASGHTEVTLTSIVEIAANPVARIAERVMCRFLAKQSDTMLIGLAQRVEGSHDISR